MGLYQISPGGGAALWLRIVLQQRPYQAPVRARCYGSCRWEVTPGRRPSHGAQHAHTIANQTPHPQLPWYRASARAWYGCHWSAPRSHNPASPPRCLLVEPKAPNARAPRHQRGPRSVKSQNSTILRGSILCEMGVLKFSLVSLQNDWC